MSLYRRLLLAVIVATVAIAACCVSVYRLQEGFVSERVDNRLMNLEESVQAVVRKLTTTDRRQPLIETALSDVFVGEVMPKGEIEILLAPVDRPSAKPFLSDALLLNRPQTVGTNEADSQMRILVTEINGGQQVVIGISLDENLKNLTTLRRLLAALFLISTAVIILVFWWVVVLGIKPIRGMVEAARAVASKDRRVRMNVQNSSVETAELGTAINKMIDELELSERRMANFVADASHELRTPLTTVRGYSDLYLSGALNRDSDIHDAMSRISSTSARMSGIIEDLLALVVEGETTALVPTSIDVGELLQQCAEEGHILDPSRTFSVLCESGLTLSSDRDRVIRVVMAFVENAVVHSRQGGAIEIKAQRLDDCIRVEVSDDGPGVPPSLVSHIFQPFVKADTARTQRDTGSGLGLAIASRLVESMRGQIGVDTNPNRATFWFTLPS